MLISLRYFVRAILMIAIPYKAAGSFSGAGSLRGKRSFFGCWRICKLEGQCIEGFVHHHLFSNEGEMLIGNCKGHVRAIHPKSQRTAMTGQHIRAQPLNPQNDPLNSDHAQCL